MPIWHDSGRDARRGWVAPWGKIAASRRRSPAVALAVPIDQASLLPDIVAVAKGGNVQVLGKGNGFLVGIAIKFVGVPDRAVMTNKVDGVECH